MARRRYSLDTMKLPNGRKFGVKKESTSERVARSKIADRCAPIKSQIEIIPKQHWDELAATQWHGQVRRDRYRYTLDQNGVGSCASESATGIKAACDERQGLPMIVYNPWSIYWYTSGGRDRGSVIGDNVEYIRDHGVCPEEVWPRSKGWRAQPSAEAKQIAKLFRIVEFFYIETTAELVSALLAGYDVHGGYSGHAVAFCRYLGRNTIEFKNSWGNWGDNGFGTLSLSKVYFPYGCYAYKFVHPWTEEDWKPALSQIPLADAVNRYMNVELQRSRAGKRPLSQQAADRLYAEKLANCSLSLI